MIKDERVLELIEIIKKKKRIAVESSIMKLATLP
ncbi:Uncharacterised protein [Streptococcus pneumoniae]|nr:Uncharacterised protein [Streptococcus pneumoniae]